MPTPKLNVVLGLSFLECQNMREAFVAFLAQFNGLFQVSKICRSKRLVVEKPIVVCPFKSPVIDVEGLFQMSKTAVLLCKFYRSLDNLVVASRCSL